MAQKLKAQEAADLCGVSRQTIQTWYNEGLSRQPTTGELLQFLAHRQGYAPGSERERLARAQAEKFELENARRRGELTLVALISELLKSMAADIAGRLDGLAGRLANELAGISDAAVIRERLLTECRAIRSGFADHIRSITESDPSTEVAGDDISAAAPAKRKRVGRSVSKTAARKRRARAMEK